MSKSQPTPPAPVLVQSGPTSEEQARLNTQAALEQRSLNMVNQYSPEGALEFTQRLDDDGNPVTLDGITQMDATQSFAPAQQALFDSSNRISQSFADTGEQQLGAVRDSLATPFTLDQFGNAPVVNEATRNATRDSIIQRLQPQMDIDRDALDQMLQNQGHVVDSPGYNNAMDEASRAKNDLYLAADAQSGNEMSRMFGLESSARDRAINEALMARSQPLSEMNAFITGSQPSRPSFVPTPQGQIAAPDFLGLEAANANMANNVNLAGFNARSNAATANTQGLYGLLGAGAMGAGYKWSDRRLKRSIRPLAIGCWPIVYAFKYIWSDAWEVGYMADEVAQAYPDAVRDVGGFLQVNYAEVPHG